ncbi:transcriptional regulator [Bacillus australimaris]|uniref:Transcriptional regulator n=1 Tax=Bacillus australimaris TaxID=1326968 RepID=A0ABD4QJV3_9BACI|nr:transcriptional regulator GutM [Bacillus australimaris]KPN13554.1 transcriptional regulator [Bacillus australimaris]MBR8690692.1 transcriptional regulator GutM [Bacillus australimaris]
MEKLAIVLCIILVVQYGLSFIQIKYYRKSMDSLIDDYKGKQGYHLFSGMERRKFGPGAIALIIVDESYIIQKCHVLGGVSILSKFKELPSYEGKHVGTVLDEHHMMKQALKKRKRGSAVMQALSMAAEQALVSISKKNITNVN